MAPALECLRRVKGRKVNKLSADCLLSQMDMFSLTPDELQLILSSCKRLQHLRICLDAPISKLVRVCYPFARALI